MTALWFVSLAFVSMACGQVVYIPVPVSFITPQSQKMGPEIKTSFMIPLCGGCQYDGQLAQVSINLANHAWSVPLGDVIYLKITDAQGHPIANNTDPATGAPTTDFEFRYSKNNGDLYLTSETGKGTSYVFTIYLKFDYNRTMTKVGRRYHQDCDVRHEMNLFERWTLEKMNARSDVIVMIPLFQTDIVNEVDPDSAVFFRMDYCFGPKLQYNITVTTISTLTTSGFATYVCLDNYQPTYHCDVNTPFKDNSGAGANFVNAVVDHDNFGPIYVIVRGEGRYKIKNKFVLAASPYH